MNRQQIAEARKNFKTSHPYVIAKIDGFRKERAIFGAERTPNGRLKLSFLKTESVEVPVIVARFNEDGSTTNEQVSTTHDLRTVLVAEIIPTHRILSVRLPVNAQPAATEILNVIESLL